MNQDQARRMAEEVELQAIPSGRQFLTTQEAQDYAREAIAAALVKLTQGQEPVAWLVCSVNADGSLSLEHAAAWEEAAHEHINDAITEHGIEGAASWVVRTAFIHPAPIQQEERKPLTDVIAKKDTALQACVEALGRSEPYRAFHEGAHEAAITQAQEALK